MAVASLPRPVESAPGRPSLPPGDWPAQGEWTYEDYLRLPDIPGRRYEILFGVLHMADTPDLAHQMVVSRLDRRIGTLVEDGDLGDLLVAPVEVRLGPAADPVPPDVLFIRAERRDIIKTQCVDGPPDLVVEVLSPGTMRTDRITKLNAYEQAGVPEYWIVDPKGRTVEVYTLDGGEYALLGQYAVGEEIHSSVLAELALPVAALFPGT